MAQNRKDTFGYIMYQNQEAISMNVDLLLGEIHKAMELISVRNNDGAQAKLAGTFKLLSEIQQKSRESGQIARENGNWANKKR